jgi:hypothetical protein
VSSAEARDVAAVEPAPCDDALAAVRRIVAAVASGIERRLYAFEDVAARFCNRSAAEILAQGHVHYATPCADLSTAAGLRLREAGFRPVPVLCRIRRLFQPVKFQCGLELELDGAPWYVGFSVTTSRLARGRFAPGRSRTHVLRAAWDAAPPGAPHLAFFGLDSPAGVDGLFRGHDLARHLRSYRATTAPSAFERARRRAEEKLGGADRAELCGAARFVARGASP